MRIRMPGRPGPRLVGSACATALLAGVLTTPSVAAPVTTEAGAPTTPAAEPTAKNFDPALQAAAEEAAEARTKAVADADAKAAAAKKTKADASAARAQAATAATEAAVKKAAAAASGSAAAKAAAAAAAVRAQTLETAANAAAAKAAAAAADSVKAEAAVAAAAAAAARAGQEAKAATACWSTVPTYVPTIREGAGDAIGTTITRYVDWDPKSSEYGHLFSTEKTASLRAGESVFSGGGTRLFKVSPLDKDSLSSYRDRTVAGGELLTPEYTFADQAGLDWTKAKAKWADAEGRIVHIDGSGALSVHAVERQKGSTAEARLTRVAQLPATTPALQELAGSTLVWAAGDTVHGFLDGAVRSWTYEVKAGSVTLTPADSALLTGLTDVVHAWSPAPGAVYLTNAEGTVRKYAGSPLALIDDDIASEITGGFAGAAACLTAAPDEAPYFGARPTDPDVPEEPAPEPEPEPEPDPTGPARVSGRFTLGDGSPAAGLEVSVGAVVPAEGETVEEPELGKVTTKADGTWSLTLPEKLPAAAQAAADANGGALNVTASTVGTTTSGVRMLGVEHLTAAPPDPQSGKASRFALEASRPAERSTELIPLLDEDAPENNLPEPTEQQRAQTYAEQAEADPVHDDAPVPRWQNDRGASDLGFNPYLIKGRDVSSERVAPYGGSCHWVVTSEKKSHAYTTVGEAHANWDAKATFEYEDKVSNQIDVAINPGRGWTLSGEASVGNSSGAISGYANQGPFFAKEWRIPLLYERRKHWQVCSSGQRGFYRSIRAVKYDIPSGGYAGRYGKDVTGRDGRAAFDKSNKKYRTRLAPRSTQGINRGKSIKWKQAASVLGVSLGSTLQYDKNHTQKITIGNKTGNHWAWGHRDKLSGKPGVFYSN